MGVQTLTSLLQRNTRPQVVCLPHAGPRPKSIEGKTLLVDASAVEYALFLQLGAANVDWRSTAWHQKLYTLVAGFYRGLQATGLHIVLVLDTAPTPGHEPLYAERRQKAIASGQPMPPLALPVMLTCYADLGLEVIRSVHSADKTLLAYYKTNKATTYALLTNDSDFYVYGVPK